MGDEMKTNAAIANLKFPLAPAVILLILVFALGALKIGFTGAFTAGGYEWEDMEKVTVDSTVDKVQAHVEFGTYKPVDCSDGVYIEANGEPVKFKTKNEVYENGVCAETDIVFNNIIYVPSEEPETPPEEEQVEELGPKYFGAGITGNAVAENVAEEITYEIYYGLVPSGKEIERATGGTQPCTFECNSSACAARASDGCVWDSAAGVCYDNSSADCFNLTPGGQILCAGERVGGPNATNGCGWPSIDPACYPCTALPFFPCNVTAGCEWNGTICVGIDVCAMPGNETNETVGDFGDAPDSTHHWNAICPPGLMTAYPIGGPGGVIAQYPTVFDIATGIPQGPCHNETYLWVFFGNNVSMEVDADQTPDEDLVANVSIANLDPCGNLPDTDFQDDGLNTPLHMDNCTWANFTFTVTITNNILPIWGNYSFNAWFDWNRDGDWADSSTCFNASDAPEWAVQNQVVHVDGYSNITQIIITSNNFLPYNPNDEPIWMRMTLDPDGTMQPDGSGPGYCFEDGETEDYYLIITGTSPPTEVCEYNETCCGTGGYMDENGTCYWDGNCTEICAPCTESIDWPNCTGYCEMGGYACLALANHTCTCATPGDFNCSELAAPDCSYGVCPEEFNCTITGANCTCSAMVLPSCDWNGTCCIGCGGYKDAEGYCFIDSSCTVPCENGSASIDDLTIGAGETACFENVVLSITNFLTIESGGEVIFRDSSLNTDIINDYGEMSIYGPPGTIHLGTLTVTGNFTLNNDELYLACFSDGGCGINVTGSGRINITNNSLITANDRTRRYWFWLGGAGGSTINDSVVSYMYDDGSLIQGITIASNNNTIYGNRILHGKTWGLTIGEVQNNIIQNNYFDNPLNAQDNGNNNDWSATKAAGTNIIGGNYLGGNYWSNYNIPLEDCIDNNNDGLCGNPYNIPGTAGSQDNLPLTPLHSREWPTFHYGPKRTGYNHYADNLPLTNDTLWNYTVTNCTPGYPCFERSSIVVDDGIAFVPSHSDQGFLALNLSNGQLLWNNSIVYSITSGAAVDKDIIFTIGWVGGDTLLALNKSTGQILWTKAFVSGAGTKTTPAVLDGVVYTTSFRGPPPNYYNVRAIYINGTVKWGKFYSPSDIPESSPVVAGNTVYFTAACYPDYIPDGCVYALDASDGSLLWKKPLGPISNPFRTTPAIVGDVLYVAGDSLPKVFALNVTTGGTEIWNTTLGDYVMSSPAVAYGLVYVSSLDNKTYALNATNGNIEWNITQTCRPWFTSPAVADETVFIGGDALYALNASNGNEIWKYNVGCQWLGNGGNWSVGAIESSPAITTSSNGSMVLIAYDFEINGTVYGKVVAVKGGIPLTFGNWTNITVLPEGIYEPQCCGVGGCSGVQGQTGDVNCENTSIDLLGTHLHTFYIEVENVTCRPFANLTCYIQQSNGTIFDISKSLGNINNETHTLNYTVNLSDSVENNAPWKILNCSLLKDGLVLKSETVNHTVYVHKNTWTKYVSNGDGQNSLECYIGSKNVYFNNTVKCEWGGDVVFAFYMANRNTVEGLCSDSIDNFGDGDGIDCADQDCKGISYPSCWNISEGEHPGLAPMRAPSGPQRTLNQGCGRDNICTGSVVYGGVTVNYKYTRNINPNGTLKVRFDNGVLNTAGCSPVPVASNTISALPAYNAYSKYAAPSAITLQKDVTTATSYLTKNETGISSKDTDQVMYLNYSSLSEGEKTFELIVAGLDCSGDAAQKVSGLNFYVDDDAPKNWDESESFLTNVETEQIKGTQYSNHTCNDGEDNDLDYATDCADADCNGKKIGVTVGDDAINCEYGAETTCWDGFDNDDDGLVDCADSDCNNAIGAFYSGSTPVKYNNSPSNVAYCEYGSTAEGTLKYGATPSSCNDTFDNDADYGNQWDNFACDGTYAGCRGKIIDCFDAYSCWGRTGTNSSLGGICPEFEDQCSDDIDNDYDVDLQGSSSNWRGVYIPDPGLDSTGADCDDYDCAGDANCPSNESANAGWCFDSIDNDLDAWIWNGTDYTANTAGGIDCTDSDCTGIVDPDTGQSCQDQEFNLTLFLTQTLNNYCDDSFDNDADGPKDCNDNDCKQRFNGCRPCPDAENITWDSCANNQDDDTDASTDCADADCNGEIGDAADMALCESGGESTCDDGFDNDRTGGADCADNSCNTVGYCEFGAEATCNDDKDNDADGLIDCIDDDCWGTAPCASKDWSNVACISIPNTASGAIGSGGTANYQHQNRLYVNDDYILRFTSSVSHSEISIIVAENDASWGKRFPYNTTLCNLEGDDSDDFEWTAESTGYSGKLEAKSASLPLASFDIYLNCSTPGTAQPQRSYSVNVFAQPNDESKSATLYTRLYENTAPTVSKIEVEPSTGAKVVNILHGSSFDVRANASDDTSGICQCNFDLDGSVVSSADGDCIYIISGLTADDASYPIKARATDGADNTGNWYGPDAYTINVLPKQQSFADLNRVFFKSSVGSLSLNAGFVTATNDNFDGATCNVQIKNSTGVYNTTTITKSGSGNTATCTGTIDVSGYPDGEYFVTINITDSDTDTAVSDTRVFYVCNNLTGKCKKADFDGDGYTEGINSIFSGLIDSLTLVCDNCPNDYNPDQADFDMDGFGDECDNFPSIYNPNQSEPARCSAGTTLCIDGTCQADCTGHGGPVGCLDDTPNGNCEYGEGCGCEDCEGEQDWCETGLVCSESGLCTQEGKGGGGGRGRGLGVSARLAPLCGYAELYTNIEPNIIIKVDVGSLCSALYNFEFTVNRELYNTELWMDTNADLPNNIPAPDGYAIEVWNVDNARIDNSDISYVKIRFRIKKSFIDETGLDPNGIILQRYTDKWTKLPTTRLSGGLIYNYYEATSPGFSYFAITGEEAKALPAFVCGNGICESELGENALNCPQDCVKIVPFAPRLPYWLLLIIAVLLIALAIGIGYREIRLHVPALPPEVPVLPRPMPPTPRPPELPARPRIKPGRIKTRELKELEAKLMKIRKQVAVEVAKDGRVAKELVAPPKARPIRVVAKPKVARKLPKKIVKKAKIKKTRPRELFKELSKLEKTVTKIEKQVKKEAKR